MKNKSNKYTAKEFHKRSNVQFDGWSLWKGKKNNMGFVLGGIMNVYVWVIRIPFVCVRSQLGAKEICPNNLVCVEQVSISTVFFDPTKLNFG